jgi:hypothetical protein
MKHFWIMILATGLVFFAQAAQADWSTAKRLTLNSGESEKPSIAVDSSGNPHVVWRDNTPGNFEIYYKKWTDE